MKQNSGLRPLALAQLSLGGREGLLGMLWVFLMSSSSGVCLLVSQIDHLASQYGKASLHLGSSLHPDQGLLAGWLGHCCPGVRGAGHSSAHISSRRGSFPPQSGLGTPQQCLGSMKSGRGPRPRSGTCPVAMASVLKLQESR